jgi:regulator of nonsense transcripts 2
MEIPLDSSIAMSTTLQREQNKVEQERMKRLVLDYDMRQEEADKQGSCPFLFFLVYLFSS